MNEKSYIYCLKDPTDFSLKYVGKSNNPYKRYYGHIGDVKKGYKTKKCNWIRKLLKNNLRPILEILEECGLDNWEQREIFWIEKLKPFCNHKRGGGGPTHIPQEKTSKPVLQYDLDNNFVMEYPSINEASRQTGLELANISNACNGKLRHTGFFVWRIKGNKNEISSDKKSVRQKNREVIQMDMKNNIIFIYESIQKAVEMTNIPRTSISNCCFSNREHLNYSAYGFKWQFKNRVYYL